MVVAMNGVSIDAGGRVPLYEQVAERLGALVEQGTFRTGDRVPSIRQLSRQLDVSINTVMQAYAVLEDRRVIEARPQSGYYVCSRFPEIADSPVAAKQPIAPAPVTVSELCHQVLLNMMNSDLVPLGGVVPNPALLPTERLNRMLASESRRFPVQNISYILSPGCERLRTEIAKRALLAGCTVRPDEVVVTSGCVEAVYLALRAVCRPGDNIAIESPVYFNFLQMIRELGLNALEIPTTPREGMSIEALGYAIGQNPVKACLVIANFGNPLGSLMPDGKKRELVELLARHEIPLIEDDIYGDLAFSNERPVAVKAYDRKGMVLYCSSFSKTVAPGYRVGWMIPGRFQSEVERLKMIVNVATPSPTQLAMAEFLANGGYDHHLRSIRKAYARQTALMAEAVGRCFPAGTRVTRPAGSSILWVEMPERVDAITLYHQAFSRGISIAPGPIFSMNNSFRNYIRLNSSFWSPQIEEAIRILGALAAGQ